MSKKNYYYRDSDDSSISSIDDNPQKKYRKYESSEESLLDDKPQKKNIEFIKETIDKYKDDDIRNIMFEDINENYAYGKLGPFNVIIMKKNGYINASKFCKDANKKYNNWANNKKSNKLISTLKKLLNDNVDPIKKIITGDNLTRGTYVHPELIIHIAAWCSAEYALQVSKIVIEYHSKEAINEKNKLLRLKDDKIDKLNKKIDILLEGNDGLKVQNKKLNKKMKLLLDKNDEIYEQNENLSYKIDEICNYRVIPGKPEDNHMIYIIKNNDDDDDDDDEDEEDKAIRYDYTIKRVMKKSAKKRLREHKKRHPNMDLREW